MSSSIQAIRDDEEDWHDFCKKHDIKQSWNLYGREYYHARALHKLKGFTGRQLLLAVRHAIEQDDLNNKQTEEWKEMETLLHLESKYA